MSIVAGHYPAAQDAAIQMSVLGALQVRRDGRWTPAPTRQVARVATVLAGWPGQPVERDRIIAAVWGERTPSTAVNTLQVHVSHLRRLIGKDLVRSVGHHYLLDLPADAVDAEQFQRLVAESARMRRRRHHGRARELLTEAIGLWRGTPFPDVFDPDLEARRARLLEMRDQAREDLLECRLELATDHYALNDVVAEAREMVSRNPLRERGHALLVRALAASDRSSEASAAFEEAAERMRSTMGLDPGRELVTVHSLSLNRDQAIAPALMSAVDGVPPARPANAQAALVADRVREAVTDLGANLVTVIERRSADRPALAHAICAALRDDMVGGVLLLNETDATKPKIDSMLGTMLDADQFDTATWPKRDGLAIVVPADDSESVRELWATLASWPSAPTLVVVSPSSLGASTEVVVSAVPTPSAAIADAEILERGA